MPLAAESGPDANLLIPSGFGLPKRIVRGHSLPDYPDNVTDAEKAMLAIVDEAYVMACEQRGRADVHARFQQQEGRVGTALGVVVLADGSESMAVGQPGSHTFDENVRGSIRGWVGSAIRELHALRWDALTKARAARRAA